ncbi:MAG TPA: hypothetical protein VGD22_08910 [Sphingobacteriaceae bacterium]
MSDKEFDKIFKDGFDDFSVTPSKSLWPSIESELANKKRIKRFPLFWVAAASVIVVFITGLYLFRPKQKIWLHEVDNQVVLVKPEQKNITSKVTDSAVKKQKPNLTSALNKKMVAAPKSVETHKKISVPNPKPVVTVSVIPVNKVVAKIEAHEKHTVNKVAMVAIPDQQEVLKSALLPDSVSQKNEVIASRRRIKSVGDLVNFVVAKVDQREDKVIEMADNDEGSSITGINIGVLKIKSTNKNNKTPGGFTFNFK